MKTTNFADTASLTKGNLAKQWKIMYGHQTLFSHNFINCLFAVSIISIANIIKKYALTVSKQFPGCYGLKNLSTGPLNNRTSYYKYINCVLYLSFYGQAVLIYLFEEGDLPKLLI